MEIIHEVKLLESSWLLLTAGGLLQYVDSVKQQAVLGKDFEHLASLSSTVDLVSISSRPAGDRGSKFDG